MNFDILKVGMLRQATKNQLFYIIRVGKNRVMVNLLQVVDDTLFLYEAKIKNIIIITSMLRCFELILGLRINFHKSKIGGILIDKDLLKNEVSVFTCQFLLTTNPNREKFKKKIVLDRDSGENKKKVKEVGRLRCCCLYENALLSQF